MTYNFKRPKFFTSTVPVLEGRDLLRVTDSLDFGSIAAGASADLTLTVPGATVGDDVYLAGTSAPASALVEKAWVSATDVVTVRAYNPTAGAVDQAAVDYTAIVWKR